MDNQEHYFQISKAEALREETDTGPHPYAQRDVHFSVPMASAQVFAILFLQLPRLEIFSGSWGKGFSQIHPDRPQVNMQRKLG